MFSGSTRLRRLGHPRLARITEVYSSSEFHSLYSTRDFLCDLIANRRLTRKTATPAGIVKNMKKTAAPPPVESSLTYIIGQNATHAEITEIATMLRTMLGRSTKLPTRAGEYALPRHHAPQGEYLLPYIPIVAIGLPQL